MGWFDHGEARIWYQDSGSGDPVLLLPGFADGIDSHRRLRDALAPHARVIAAELPGSGRSLPQPRTYRPSYYDDDAAAFAALLDHLGAAPAHLVGHSDGGEVALVLAANHPGAARSVVAWGAAGAVADPDGRLAAFFREVIDGQDDGLDAFRASLIAAYGIETARATTRSFAEAIDAAMTAGGDISQDRAHRIACPVLLLNGTQDPFSPKPLVDRLASRLARVRSVSVNGVGHALHEDRPDWFTRTVTAWVQGGSAAV